MHKKIKYIIAATLVTASISGYLPINMFENVEVYAATYSSAKTGQLSSLKLTWNNGKSEIKLLDSYYGDEVDLSDDKEYYANVKSINEFNVSADVKGSGYVAKIFTSSSKTAEGSDSGEEISMGSGYKDIYIRTYKSEEAYEEAYDNGDVTDCESTYVVHLRKTNNSSSIDGVDDTEYAYLEGISLSTGYIDFSKDTTSYDVDVNENITKITVGAITEDDDDYVEINGQAVYKDDDFEKTVSLKKGNNTITIHVEHEDDDITYTLNVYRGKTENASQNTSNSQGSTITFSQNGTTLNSWNKVNGKWRYIDGTGEPLKDTWWYDKDSQSNYYLDKDGYRTTGWLSKNGNWYYFNEDGKMQTGWVNTNKNWYYLNKAGIMQMGWLEDSSGNWYYLDSSGKMITDSTVDGYELGNDGALIN